MEDRTAENRRENTLRFLAEPTDINYLGKVHGGAVMKWIDQAGYACAVGWSHRNSVTVYVGGIRFYKPILVGYIVECCARLIYTGHTSMHIAVDVYAGDPRQNKLEKMTHCIIIYVALDEQGKPAEVPKWTPETQADRELEEYARRLMELRKGVEEEMARHTR